MIPFKSIAENFYETGAEELLFRTPASSSVAPYNLSDLNNLPALDSYLKARGSIGSTTGERVSDDLLTLLARDKRNPLRLEDNEIYVVTPADHFVVEYGTIDGVSSVWDRIIAPHLKDYGISVDPGVVPPTPGRPDGGVLEQPTPIGTASDPAMKLVNDLRSVLIAIGAWTMMDGVTAVNETGFWKDSVQPLLDSPLAG